MKNAGEVLQKLRKKNGDTQEALAGKLGIGRTAVTKYELGIVPITHPMIVQICKTYKEDPKIFF